MVRAKQARSDGAPRDVVTDGRNVPVVVQVSVCAQMPATHTNDAALAAQPARPYAVSLFCLGIRQKCRLPAGRALGNTTRLTFVRPLGGCSSQRPSARCGWFVRLVKPNGVNPQFVTPTFLASFTTRLFGRCIVGGFVARVGDPLVVGAVGRCFVGRFAGWFAVVRLGAC